MGHRTGLVTFKYTIGMTYPFIGDTISFQSVCGNQILDKFYEKVAIGYSAIGMSGTFGMRFMYYTDAVPRNTANGIVLNAVSGFTGIGASSGLVNWNAYGVTTFPGNGWPTPSVIHVERAAGASNSGTLVIAGILWNPYKG